MSSMIKFAFFGTSQLAVYVLEELRAAGFLTAFVVTMPDKPQGRGLELTPSAVKLWANQHKLDVFEADASLSIIVENMRGAALDVAIVCDFGKILSEQLLEIPTRGFLNVHPSLLPRLRGASPICSAIGPSPISPLSSQRNNMATCCPAAARNPRSAAWSGATTSCNS